MAQPVCAIAGIGPGNGESLARRFTKEGYGVALLSRNETYLKAVEKEIPGTRAYPYDVTEVEKAGEIFNRIKEEMGPVEVLIYNAGSGMFSSIEETSPEAFEYAWRVNTLGCLVCSQQVIPDMRALGRGNIIVIGAGAALRGRANTAPFASAKAAQRSLAQSMARHLGDDRIHVSYVIIDGVISIPKTREIMPDTPDEFFLRPEDIAESVFFLAQQPQSAWTFELDVRPFCEKW